MTDNKTKVLILHAGFSTDISVTDMLRLACSRNGLDLIDVSIDAEDLQNNDFELEIIDKLDGEIDKLLCVVSLNVAALYLFRTPGECIHDNLNVPLVLFLIDHPSVFLELIPANLSNTLVLLIDDSFERFWHKHYSGMTLSYVCNVMPYSKYEIPAPPSFEVYRKRSGKILAPMQLSIHNYDALGWWHNIDQLKEPLRGITKEAVTAMIGDATLEFDVFVDGEIEKHGVELESEDRITISQYVDCFARLWRRQVVISSLLEFPIVVSSGTIPDTIDSKYHDKFIDTSGDETMKLFAEHQMILNVSPAISSIIHDRVINCINTASTLISESNRSIVQFLEPGRDFVDIPFEPEKIREKVGNILEDPRKAYDIAVSGYETWHNNDEIHKPWREIFEMVRMMSRNM